MMHYSLASVGAGPGLVFDWDQESGTVTGPDAGYILDVAASGHALCHPWAWVHTLSAEPTKSRADMAAIVGLYWELPDDLIQHYPQLADDSEDPPPDALI